MNTADEMLKFVNDTKEDLIKKIVVMAHGYEKHSIFDYPRHRIFFPVETNLSTRIGTT